MTATTLSNLCESANLLWNSLSSIVLKGATQPNEMCWMEKNLFRNALLFIKGVQAQR